MSTPGEFAFGAFRPRVLEPNIDRADFRRRLATHLFDLGCTLEDRILLAQGAGLGVFSESLVREWLFEHDPLTLEYLSLADSLGSTDDRERLPEFIDLAEVLQQPLEDAATNFRGFLLMRAYERGEYADIYANKLYYRTLLFGNDADWDLVLSQLHQAVARFLEEQSPSSYELLSVLEPAYDSLMLPADYLSFQLGAPLGESDPWGLQGPAAYQVPFIGLSALDKSDRTTSEQIRDAAVLVLQTPPDGVPERVRELIREYLLLRLLHFASLAIPRDPDESSKFDERGAIVDTLSARESSLVALRLSAGMCWAESTWRIAPCDERSVRRQISVIELLRPALERVSEHLREAGEMP